MSVNLKSSDVVRVKKEPTNDPQFTEPDSSTNSTSNSGETTTRQNSLQRIQMRKEKVNKTQSMNKQIYLFSFLNKFLFCSLRFINCQKSKKWPNWQCIQHVKRLNVVVLGGKHQKRIDTKMLKAIIVRISVNSVEMITVNIH